MARVDKLLPARQRNQARYERMKYTDRRVFRGFAAAAVEFCRLKTLGTTPRTGSNGRDYVAQFSMARWSGKTPG